LSWARGHPDGNPSFVPPFGGFRLADRFRPIVVSCRADAAVDNQHPLGNCFLLKLETGLSVLNSVPLPEGRGPGLCPATTTDYLAHRSVPDARQRVLQPARGGFWPGLRPYVSPLTSEWIFRIRWRATATAHSCELCLFLARSFAAPNDHPATEVTFQLNLIANPWRFKGGSRISLACPFAQFSWDLS